MRDTHEELLHRLYNNPTTGYVSAQKLYRLAKPIDRTITHKIIKEWYAQQPNIAVHAEQRKKPIYFRIASDNPNSGFAL